MEALLSAIFVTALFTYMIVSNHKQEKINDLQSELNQLKEQIEEERKRDEEIKKSDKQLELFSWKEAKNMLRMSLGPVGSSLSRLQVRLDYLVKRSNQGDISPETIGLANKGIQQLITLWNEFSEYIEKSIKFELLELEQNKTKPSKKLNKKYLSYWLAQKMN